MEVTQQLLAEGHKPAASGGSLEAEVEARLKMEDERALKMAAEKARHDCAANEQAESNASFGALGNDMFSGYMK